MGSINQRRWLVRQLNELKYEKGVKKGQIEVLTQEVDVLTQDIGVVESLLEAVESSQARSYSQDQGYGTDPPTHPNLREWQGDSAIVTGRHSLARKQVHPYPPVQGSGSHPLERRDGINLPRGYEATFGAATAGAEIQAGRPPGVGVHGGGGGPSRPPEGGSGLLSMLNSINSCPNSTNSARIYQAGSNNVVPNDADGQNRQYHERQGYGYL